MITLPSTHDLGSAANRARLAAGLPLLGWDPRLATAARAHAGDLVRSATFSHSGTDGSNALERVKRCPGHWSLVGENLAMGMGRPEEAVVGWLASPGHRANLLRSEFTHAGAAVVPLPFRPSIQPGFMWVQVYGTPVAPPFRSPSTGARPL